jgi:hypothetical protein
MVTDSAWPSTRISIGSSTATSSRRPSRSMTATVRAAITPSSIASGLNAADG